MQHDHKTTEELFTALETAIQEEQAYHGHTNKVANRALAVALVATVSAYASIFLFM